MEHMNFALSYILIILTLLLARREGLGNEAEIFISSLRSALQLMALGYLLRYLLGISDPVGVMGVVLLMVLVASVIAYERVRMRGVFMTAFLSIGGATFLTVLPLLWTGILEPTAHQLIPFCGLIVGNSLNSVSLALDRFMGEVRNRREEIEAKVALGSSLRTAMDEAFRDSLRASLIPKINFMKAAGLVHIPGVAVGMLMAGADPLEAVLFQVVILYSLVFAGLLGSLVMLYTNYRRVFRYL
ncbi:MAG: iron export ABC transporter permease subunit FetB [Aquificota bacterium]|nr:iron export ABC transporter permease subunit FetB [Aquificota bacterium]